MGITCLRPMKRLPDMSEILYELRKIAHEVSFTKNRLWRYPTGKRQNPTTDYAGDFELT
jgi:hypothetical protein